MLSGIYVRAAFSMVFYRLSLHLGFVPSRVPAVRPTGLITHVYIRTYIWGARAVGLESLCFPFPNTCPSILSANIVNMIILAGSSGALAPLSLVLPTANIQTWLFRRSAVILKTWPLIRIIQSQRLFGIIDT